MVGLFRYRTTNPTGRLEAASDSLRCSCVVLDTVLQFTLWPKIEVKRTGAHRTSTCFDWTRHVWKQVKFPGVMSKCPQETRTVLMRVLGQPTHLLSHGNVFVSTETCLSSGLSTHVCLILVSVCHCVVPSCTVNRLREILKHFGLTLTLFSVVFQQRVIFQWQTIGDLYPLLHQAFFGGKLKISGNMGMAMKLQDLQVKPGKAKLWDSFFSWTALINKLIEFFDHLHSLSKASFPAATFYHQNPKLISMLMLLSDMNLKCW